MTREWKRLPLGRHETCPPLFFKFNRSSKGYEISLTDLVYIWSESLSYKEVLSRASNLETSIDPSEDGDQFSVLLQKVEDALRGAKGSTVSLNRSKEEHGLDLSTTTKLPSPLEPLEWTLHLSRLPQNALTRQILLPILKGEANRAARTQSLIELLKEKDAALSKIFDKIESSGLDISRNFPGLSGERGERKGSALAQVSRVVKGVAPFDERAWNSNFASGECGDLGMNFASELDSIHSYRDWDAVQSNLLEEWWVRIESHISLNNKSKEKPVRKISPKRHQKPIDYDDATASDSDDEFQRQETPPHLRRSRTSASSNRQGERRAKSPENQPTESYSRSELENAQGSPSPPRRSQKTKPARKGLGTIGAKTRKPPTPRVEESTASESDETVPPPGDKYNRKPKVLGSIGGNKSRLAPKSTAESTASESFQSDKPPDDVARPTDVPTASESEEDEKPRIPSKRKEPESTEEDNESDVQTTGKKPQRSRIGSLGQVGGKKRKEHKLDNRKRASPESEDESAKRLSPSPSAAPSPKPNPKPKRIGKLGTIGGGKPSRKLTPSQKEAEGTASGTDSDSAAAHTRKASPLKKHKKEEGTSQNQAEIPLASRSRSPAGTRRSAWPKEEEKKEVKEETAEERANRKRKELRRQMETKGPAKKKRRF